MRNGYIESFNGKFRNRYLNEQRFQMLHKARSTTAMWRQDFIEVRPHGSIERIPPPRFAHFDHRNFSKTLFIFWAGSFVNTFRRD